MIDEPALLNFLQREESRAVDTQVMEERATALAFYRGEKFGDEIEGRSQLRTRDVAEVVDHMLTSVMAALLSSGRIVEFEPVSPVMASDERGERDLAPERAQEATDRVHWNFLREQDGYGILRDGVKAGLLEKTGVWKTWVETPKVEQAVRLNALELDATEGVVEAAEVDDVFDLDADGVPLSVYDATVLVDGPPVFRDAAIPNEEFFVSPDARTLDSAAYCGNTARLALADIAAMGYPVDRLENLYGEDSAGKALRDARDGGTANREADVARDDLARIVTLREEYCRWMWQGRWQLIRVHRVASTILSIEPASMIPYVLWCPFPMPHRLVGHSLADKVLDIQVVRSHMLRQAMDNLYLSNAPRTFVPEEGTTENTIDDLLDVAPGALIRGKVGAPPVPWTVPFVADNAFHAMEVMANEKAKRTGITPLNQGLKPDAMNIDTATTFRGLAEAGQQIEEAVAREVVNALAELFEKKLRLMLAFMAPHPFKIDGELREINPSEWPADMRMTVRVGLGTGSKDKRMAALQMLQGAMAQAAEFGLVGREEAFAAAKALVGSLGLGVATQYFRDPATLPPQTEQPDPEAQARMLEMQARQAEKAEEFRLREAEQNARMQLEREKAAAEMELARERMANEMQMARERMMLEMNGVGMGNARPGGSLAA